MSFGWEARFTIGGTKGVQRTPPGSKFFQFHAVLGKIEQNRMLAPPRVGAPHLGNIDSSRLTVTLSDVFLVLHEKFLSWRGGYTETKGLKSSMRNSNVGWGRGGRGCEGSRLCQGVDQSVKNLYIFLVVPFKIFLQVRNA